MKHIPNFLTSLNILCGSLAVVFALESIDYLFISSILIGVAAIFDFLDGMSARMLKAYSEMGCIARYY
jgi:CDP-diacylglycerol--serine O-phosphatidyltransferase